MMVHGMVGRKVGVMDTMMVASMVEMLVGLVAALLAGLRDWQTVELLADVMVD